MLSVIPCRRCAHWKRRTASTGTCWQRVEHYPGPAASVHEDSTCPLATPKVEHVPPSYHGRASGYTVQHCRCPRCRSANAAMMRRYRAQKRAIGQCLACRQPATSGPLCATHRAMRQIAARRRYAQQHPP